MGKRISNEELAQMLQKYFEEYENRAEACPYKDVINHMPEINKKLNELHDRLYKNGIVSDMGYVKASLEYIKAALDSNPYTYVSKKKLAPVEKTVGGKAIEDIKERWWQNATFNKTLQTALSVIWKSLLILALGERAIEYIF